MDDVLGSYKPTDSYMVDSYEIEQLKHRYELLTPKERIEFLQELGRKIVLPFELASLPVRDASASVRAWAARHMDLDYRKYEGLDKFEPRYSRPEQNLFDVLEADPDPFVRASLYENPSFRPTQIKERFPKASPLERLAIIRRPTVDSDLIKKVFDRRDTTLGIGLQERYSLTSAFLRERTDSHKVRDLHENFDAAESRASMPLTFADTSSYNLEELWTLVDNWPSALKVLVYKYVDASDETIAEAYRKSDRPELRYAMLTNEHHYSDPHATGGDCEILKLAIHDTDPAVKSAAYQHIALTDRFTDKLSNNAESLINAALQKADLPSLVGLLKNPSLPSKLVSKIIKRFSLLGFITQNIRTAFKWERLRYPKVPSTGPVAWTLEQKINYIGERCLMACSSVWLGSWLAGLFITGATIGCVGAMTTYLVTKSLPISFFLMAGLALLGALVGAGIDVVSDLRRVNVPPWMTLGEWTEQRSSYEDWAKKYTDTTSRKRDFVDQLSDLRWSHDLKPGERNAVDLCWNAKTKAEQNCLRDYFDLLNEMGNLMHKDFFAQAEK